MIKTLDLQDEMLSRTLHRLQRRAYRVEAELIGFNEIPPLMETVEELQQCGEQFLGYYEGDELLGAVSYIVEDNRVTVCRLVVDPDHFKRGIARKLLAAAEEANPDATAFAVSTGKDNFPAKNLYTGTNYVWQRDVEVAPGFYISLFHKEV